MTDPQKLEVSTAAHEGFEATPYKDSRSLWTVGNGRCLETHPFTGPEWKRLLDNGWLVLSIWEAGAHWLMNTELADVEGQLSRIFSWWSVLNDARQNALIELAYQIGISKLMGFKNMLAAIRAQDWATAYAQAMDSDWARQTPARAQTIATQLRDGEFA